MAHMSSTVHPPACEINSFDNKEIQYQMPDPNWSNNDRFFSTDLCNAKWRSKPTCQKIILITTQDALIAILIRRYIGIQTCWNSVCTHNSSGSSGFMCFINFAVFEPHSLSLLSLAAWAPPNTTVGHMTSCEHWADSHVPAVSLLTGVTGRSSPSPTNWSSRNNPLVITPVCDMYQPLPCFLLWCHSPSYTAPLWQTL